MTRPITQCRTKASKAPNPGPTNATPLTKLDKSSRINIETEPGVVLDDRWSEPGYPSKVRIKGRAASFFIRLWANFVRVQVVGWKNNLKALAYKKPILYLCWHGSQVVPLAFYRGRGIIILTSLSRDGDIQDMSMKCLGFRTVRGSSSRGGARALLGLIKQIKTFGAAAITVDGPRGPYHIAKPGAVLLAQKCDAVILPVGVAHSACHRLKSWDKFEIPLPFSKSVLVTGDPFQISPDLKIEEACRVLEDQISNCDKVAQARLAA